MNSTGYVVLCIYCEKTHFQVLKYNILTGFSVAFFAEGTQKALTALKTAGGGNRLKRRDLSP
jgi:hypothetical protein